MRTLLFLFLLLSGLAWAEPDTPVGSWLTREMGQDDFDLLEITDDTFTFTELGGRTRALEVRVVKIESDLFELQTDERKPGNMLMKVDSGRGWIILPRDAEGIDCFRRGPLQDRFLGSWRYFDPAGEGAYRQVEVGQDSFSYTFTDMDGEKSLSGDFYPILGDGKSQSALFTYREEDFSKQSLVEFRPLSGALLMTLKPKYGPLIPLLLWKADEEEPAWLKSYHAVD